jgi:hypothetical protein
MKQSPIYDAPEMVLSNSEGHLFLTKDGNKCHEQHLGLEIISNNAVEQWVTHITSLHQLRREREFKFCFLPAPDKQSVFWESLSPNPDHRNILKILDKLNSKVYFDPLEGLINQRLSEDHDPYPKVDTHWNSIGALIAVQGILTRWNIQNDTSNIRLLFEPYEFQGDLGIKTSPRQSSTAWNLSNRHWHNHVIYDNGVPDNGRIRVLSNMIAPVQERLLLVGDSFSYRLAELLALQFSEVYHFHGSFIDRSFFRVIQPDYFIFEQTERFFIRFPQFNVDSNFSRIVEEKIENGIDLIPTIDRHRKLRTSCVRNLHQASVIALSEKILTVNGLCETKSIDGFQGFLRTLRTHFL